MTTDFNLLPDYIISASKKAKVRVDEFLSKDKCFILGFITDVHTGGNEHYKHLGYFYSLKDYFNCDVLVNGGDIGLDLGEDREEAEKIIKNTKDNMPLDIPFLFTKGNHDYGTQKITNKEMVETFILPTIKKFGGEVIYDDNFGGYGYYYDKKSNTRIIFLNTSEGNTRQLTMTNFQLKYVVDKLQNANENEKIVMVSHFCPHIIGGWKSYPNEYNLDCFVAIRKIYQDFVKKTKGEIICNNEKIVWDFSKVNSGAKLVCHLCGDSHFDNYINENGVNYIVRQGYGGVDKSEMPENAMHNTFSSNENINPVKNCLFDMLCINNNGKAKIIRVGAGDIASDVEINF